jgi:hypothetical protein
VLADHPIQLRDVTRQTGIDFQHFDGGSGKYYLIESMSAGLALFDYDVDGDIDVVILNSRLPPTLLRNDLRTRNHWIDVQLRGATTNRDGVGARVEVTAGETSQIDEVHSGRGYQAHHGTRLHFGLGRQTRVDQIRVRWIGGGVDVRRNLPVDRVITITESGDGKHGT